MESWSLKEIIFWSRLACYLNVVTTETRHFMELPVLGF